MLDKAKLIIDKDTKVFDTLTKPIGYPTVSQNRTVRDVLSGRKGHSFCLLGIQKQVQIFAMCCNLEVIVKIIRQIDSVAMQPMIHVSSAYLITVPSFE